MRRTIEGMTQKRKAKCTSKSLALKMGLTEETLTVPAGEQFFPHPASSVLDTEKKAAEPRPEFEIRTPMDTPFVMGELVAAL